MSASTPHFADLPKDIRFPEASVVVEPDRVARYQSVVALDAEPGAPVPSVAPSRAAAVPPSFLYTIYLSQPGFRERYLAYGIDAEHAIHASQRFDYLRPIEPGETLTLGSEVKKILARPGATNFIVSEETRARGADGETVFVSTATFAFRATEAPLEIPQPAPRSYKETSDYPEVHVPPVEQSRLNAFAEASLDTNPIHLDASAAQAQGFPEPVVHGMLVMALMGEACFRWIPDASIDRFTIKFVASTPVGEGLIMVARRRMHDESTGALILDVAALGQTDRSVRATAEVRISTR